MPVACTVPAAIDHTYCGDAGNELMLSRLVCVSTADVANSYATSGNYIFLNKIDIFKETRWVYLIIQKSFLNDFLDMEPVLCP